MTVKIVIEQKAGAAKYMGAANIDAAQDFAAGVCQNWANSKPGRSAKRDGMTYMLRYSDGKLSAILTIEVDTPISPEVAALTARKH
jgi:hypothetical protein